MRRFDKRKNIKSANILSEERHLESKGVINENELLEVSADKIMGAAKKMWQDKIGADTYGENPRAKKLLIDYANKLVGLSIFGGEIRKVDVELKSSNGNKAMELIFTIMTSGNLNAGSDYSGIYYNFTTDQFLVGGSIGDSLRPITDFSDTSISKHDARQMYKIANHFNPETRYVNYTREIPINVNI